MANHLTPDELSEALGLARKQVVRLCVETSVPIYNGRIDKTLFVRSVTAAGHRLPAEARGAPDGARGHVGRILRRRLLLAATALAALACPAGAALGAGQVQSALSSFGRANPGTSALVWRLDGSGSGTPVASFRAETARIPASTMKLITGAGALLQFGPTFRFQTKVVAGPETVRKGKALLGSIYLKGAGDPVLATRTYAAGYLSGRATQLSGLAKPLAARGIRLVRGPIVADERIFDSRRMGPGWPSYYRLYASPLSGLPTNQDYAGNGRAAYVSSPPLAAAQRLKATLRGVGVSHVGALKVGAAPGSGPVLATAQSPPLPVILRAMNLASDNFIAETLAKDVGAYGSDRGSTRAGVARTRSPARRARDRGAGRPPGGRLGPLARQPGERRDDGPPGRRRRRRPGLGRGPDGLAGPGRRGHPDPPLHQRAGDQAGARQDRLPGRRHRPGGARHQRARAALRRSRC